MSCEKWVKGPFGLSADQGRTCLSERIVLVVVHHLTAAARLMDVVPLLESDQRIQVVYTVAPSSQFVAGADEFLRRLGGVVVPWRQATEVCFDLAMAASHGLLEQLHAPVLTLPHGASFNKYPARWIGQGPEVPRELAGLERAGLVYRGRVIPSAIVLPASRDLARLRLACPAATPVAVVGGDPCYDRLAASLPLRERYRRALDLGAHKLVAVTSTWGPGSLLRQCPDLLARLVDELPGDEYRVAAFLHPHVWAWHGRRQLLAWLASSVKRGLILMPPEEGWRATLAASDFVIGDHGSATCYGAAAGAPVLLAAFPAGEIDPGSPASQLGATAHHLRTDQPVARQLRAVAADWSPESSAAIRRMITDVPGQSGRIIRKTMYDLMKLPEPETGPYISPVPFPGRAVIPVTTGVSQ
ncbi:MAG TPA: hypothetical protein VFQ44_04180 [Streptosporangiaceae bacterium]|nr:hypothetical protein [Streptosporangiaceae bacterium]